MVFCLSLTFEQFWLCSDQFLLSILIVFNEKLKLLIVQRKYRSLSKISIVCSEVLGVFICAQKQTQMIRGQSNRSFYFPIRLKLFDTGCLKGKVSSKFQLLPWLQERYLPMNWDKNQIGPLENCQTTVSFFHNSGFCSNFLYITAEVRWSF